MTTNKRLDKEAFLYQINHVFLPPELPQKDDTNPSHEKALMETVSRALERFKSYFQPSERPELDRCIRMIGCMIGLRNTDGFLNPTKLNTEIVELSKNDTLAIHIRKQNAGLLITGTGDGVRFESFELLARNEDVMNCKGRLRRHFPGPSVTVERELITDSTFRQPFVDLLVKLDRQTGPRKKGEVERAKDERIGEEIHAVDPWRVTEMVTGLLRGLGQTSEAQRISKNTREEVLWEGREFPWRRSPLWLLIRVSLQVTCERSVNEVNSHSEWVSIYKDFMVFLMSSFLAEAQSQKLPSDLLYIMMAKISRRLIKLKPGKGAKWLSFAEKTMQDVGATMKQDWEALQSDIQDTLDLPALKTLDFARDTAITMDNLRPYLEIISSQVHATNIPKAKVVEGPSFQRNEKNYLPKSGFSQDRDFMFYELADFENWIGSNLENIWALDRELPTHGARGNEAHPHETAGKQLGPFTAEVNLFPFLLPSSFHIEDTEAEDGHIIPGIHSTEVKYLEDLHRQDKLLESASDALPGPVNDKWSYITDNSFATTFFKRPGSWPILSKQQSLTRLCDRCSNMRIFDTEFEVYLTLSVVWKTAEFCALCRLLHQVLLRVSPFHPVRPVRVYREGSNLLAGGLGQPILRICAGPDHSVTQATQIGFPALPQAGSPIHFKLLHEWLRICDKDHKNLGCHAESDGKLPTRLLNVGDKQNPDLLRLYCTKQSDRGEYVALSHCWGKPTDEEKQKSCTFTTNIRARCQNIDFKDLAKSFQDAVMVTRELGKRYLWIDSLCIVQDDPADWEREARLMETVFNEAYCTIAATSATDSTLGFLGPRLAKQYIRVSDGSDNQLFLCETVDDFTADVVDGVLNKRGWVYQERALSRRVIHFTANQTYWECGRGIHCETMTRMKNPIAQLLGDPQFPRVALRRNHAKRIRLLEILFETYSNLGLTVASDRSVAIAGLERRMAKGLNSEITFGISKCYMHRSLFWRRSGEKMMKKIKYPSHRPVPSWSWMAYDGPITYMDIPTKDKIEWSSDVELSLADSQDNNATPIPELKALVFGFNGIELAREQWRLILDVKDDVDIQKLRCVILGRQASPYHNPDQIHHVLVVSASSYPYVGYERMGVATVQWRHIIIEQGGVEAKII